MIVPCLHPQHYFSPLLSWTSVIPTPDFAMLFLLKCLCPFWSSFRMLFLPVTIWENPSRSSMDLLTLLWSFPWSSDPRYIQLNTHFSVSPSFFEHSSVVILSLWHHPNLFPYLSLLCRATEVMSYSSLSCQCKAKTFTTVYKGHMFRPHCLP